MLRRSRHCRPAPAPQGEFVVILGVAAGVLIIASPARLLTEIMHKAKEAVTGAVTGKPEYFELLKLLFELFMIGRRSGLIALEEHVMDPTHSTIFQKYPSVMHHPDRLEFLCTRLLRVVEPRIEAIDLPPWRGPCRSRYVSAETDYVGRQDALPHRALPPEK